MMGVDEVLLQIGVYVLVDKNDGGCASAHITSSLTSNMYLALILDNLLVGEGHKFLLVVSRLGKTPGRCLLFWVCTFSELPMLLKILIQIESLRGRSNPV